MHILCGVVFRDYGASVTGGNMEPLKGRMDFEFETMRQEFVREIESKINLEVEMDWGTATNFVPRTGPPVLAYQNTGVVKAVVRPTRGLTVENTYFLTRLLDQNTGRNVFNNHILRSKWNYQFTKEFSLRMIGQYVTTIANPGLTTLQNTKSFNGDVLFTYLLNPGTAIYVGYNSDLQNIDRLLRRTCGGLACAPGQAFDGLARTRNTFLNDGRQVFVKLSYLFRY